MFTGREPFPGNTESSVTRKIANGKRPSRPRNVQKLRISDELWAGIKSLWAHEAVDRPPLSTFVGLLERANPDITLLEELMEFDVGSEDHIKMLRSVFDYGENELLGMREYESLILIEVFDRVGFTVLPAIDLPQF